MPARTRRVRSNGAQARIRWTTASLRFKALRSASVSVTGCRVLRRSRARRSRAIMALVGSWWGWSTVSYRMARTRLPVQELDGPPRSTLSLPDSCSGRPGSVRGEERVLADNLSNRSSLPPPASPGWMCWVGAVCVNLSGGRADSQRFACPRARRSCRVAIIKTSSASPSSALFGARVYPRYAQQCQDCSDLPAQRASECLASCGTLSCAAMMRWHLLARLRWCPSLFD